MSGFRKIVVLLTIVACGVGVRGSYAASFKSGLGFEVGGFMANVSPEEYNRVFAQFGLEGVDRTYGFTFAVSEDLNRSWRLAIRSGYSRGSTNTGEVTVTDASGRLIGTTGYEFVIESIPLLAGADLRIANDAAALVFSLDAGVNFARVTHKIHEVGTFPGAEDPSSTTLAMVIGAVGVEFPLTSEVVFGLRGGYGLSEGDLSFPGTQDLNPKLDVGGGFVGAYFIVQPWRTKSTVSTE
jgi:hypothetical protein